MNAIFRMPETDSEYETIAIAIYEDGEPYPAVGDVQLCRVCGEAGDVRDPTVVEFHIHRCDECDHPAASHRSLHDDPEPDWSTATCWAESVCRACAS